MKYICEHSIPKENKEERIFTLSSEDKADYIAKTINKFKIPVEFISNSRTRLKKGYLKYREDRLNDKCTVISGSTFGCSNKITARLQRLHSLMWLLSFLLRKCHRKETVVFYHSVFTCIPLIVTKKLKKIIVIIEIEEIFSELNNKDRSWWRDYLERKAISIADGFIFASENLQKKYNFNNKPYVIANGKYELPEFYNFSKQKDKKILVYAGLIRNQMVAFKAVRIAKYLPENYEIRIIGYGAEREIDILKEEIKEINRSSKCKVIFDGTKRGDEYNQYLQKCDYGLCPLTTDVVYQNGCFPSKITSYLSNGLPVFTTENEVVKNSPYKDFIIFVEDDSPDKFAQCIIKNINTVMQNPRERIFNMDREFKETLKDLLKTMGGI